MFRTSLRTALALALVTMLVSAFAGTANAGETPQRGGTLTVGFPSDTKTLDPAFSVQFTERQVLYVVYNTLVKLGPDFSINPELAERWDVSDDGKTITFHLREGVKFHDGADFDAAVVKWNIDRRLDEAVGSRQRKQLAPVIDSVEVADTHTVVFNLKQPFPALFGMLAQRAGFMMSPKAVEKWGEDFGSHPVGTGAFIFKEWVRGSHITVERNPDYWEEGLPYLDGIVFRDISDSVVGVQRLLTNELDYVGQLAPHDIKLVEDKSSINLYPITVGRWYSLQWHWYEPPFDNAKLRQAIAHAIDRERINDIIMAGKGIISDGPTPPGLWWYDAKLKSYAYDPEKARALLEEAGYGDGVEIVLSTPQVSVFQQLNQLVQEQLAAVGIKARLDPVARSEWYSRVVDRTTNLTPTRWTQRPDPDGLLYILFHSQGYANTTGYNNPKLDALLDSARQTSNMAQRTKLYSQAQALIVSDLPMLPLFFSVEYSALPDHVKNFEWIPDQIPRFREIWKAAN